MNDEKMIAVLAKIEEEALTDDATIGFDMWSWFAPATNHHPCGTTACLAGWAAMNEGYMLIIEGHPDDWYSRPMALSPTGVIEHISDVGAEALRLNSRDAHDLFHLNSLYEVYSWVADKMDISYEDLRLQVKNFQEGMYK